MSPLRGSQCTTELLNPIINIYTDSLNTLNDIKYNFHFSTLAIKIDNLISEANKNIRLIRTPGHFGISGNEKAYKIAQPTANNPMMEIHFYSSLIDVHRNVSIHRLYLWELKWSTRPKSQA